MATKEVKKPAGQNYEYQVESLNTSLREVVKKKRIFYGQADRKG